MIAGLPRPPAAVVTGSKGKGSVARMASAALGAYLRVGLMTSPHLESFNERFCVDGAPIPDDELVSCVEAVAPAFDEVQRGLAPGSCISPMGIQAALALEHFRRARCDFAVLECGKGARYDDVNNVGHEYAVINSVFLEHTRELGGTVAQIAADKAHVIREGVRCAFVGPQEDEALRQIEDRARREGVRLRVYGRDFWAKDVCSGPQGTRFTLVLDGRAAGEYELGLMGEHQARNCALALALCAQVLADGLDLGLALPAGAAVADPRVRESLRAVRVPGRLEVVAHDPLVMLDNCINRASCPGLLQAVDALGLGRAAYLVGIPDDKDVEGVARRLADRAAGMVLAPAAGGHYRFGEGQRVATEASGALLAPDAGRGLELALAFGAPVVAVGVGAFLGEVRRAVRSRRPA